MERVFLEPGHLNLTWGADRVRRQAAPGILGKTLQPSNLPRLLSAIRVVCMGLQCWKRLPWPGRGPRHPVCFDWTPGRSEGPGVRRFLLQVQRLGGWAGPASSHARLQAMTQPAGWAGPAGRCPGTVLWKLQGTVGDQGDLQINLPFSSRPFTQL